MRLLLIGCVLLMATGCSRYEADKREKEYVGLKGNVYMSYVEHCARSKDVMGAWAAAGVQEKIDEWKSKAATACNYAAVAPGSGY